MNRTILVLTALMMAGHAFADDARPSMPYFGTATMDDDTVTIRLSSSADGKPATGTLTYKRGDRGFDNVQRHLGGMSPGDTKPVQPWKD